MSILVNGYDAAKLPGMLLVALSPDASQTASQIKVPSLLKDKEAMMDVLEMYAKRLSREIRNDLQGQG